MLVAVKQVLDYMEALNDTVVDVEESLRKESKLFDFPCFRCFRRSMIGNVKFCSESQLTLIHRQFCPNLAFTNHTPYEGMRVSAIFAQKSEKSL